MSSELQGDAANPTYVYVGAFVNELRRVGLRNVVICPGSRSTPLALAFAQQPAIRVWMHVDERAAAFFALGMAKRLSQPVALLCTSGTAAANFLPAIVEAHLTHVPLLVLTADRPHELRENGAPQSIDQNRLYGSHVKWFVDVALPEASNTALRSIRTLACRATTLSSALPAGPVHLNFPFREPLTPDPIPEQPLPPLEQRDPLAWQGRPSDVPYVEVQDAPLSSLSATSVQRLAGMIQANPRGLIIVGPIDEPELADPLIKLAELAGYPLLADPLTAMRCNEHERLRVLTSYDAFLRSETFIAHAETGGPQLVLRFGAMPTSKPVLLYLKRYADCPQIVIDGQQGWEEPTQLATELLHAHPVQLCRQLGERVVLSEDRAWLTSWQRAEQMTRQVLRGAIHDFQEPFEGRVFLELADLMPEGALLYAGNSMPVRDLDTFFWGCEHTVKVMGNRGANGIDGVVSSALGASAARQDGPTVLVIGDLSFLHDLNGLLAARLHRLNLVVVLINNDGGGIFSFLPQAAHPEHFEQLFGTPTGLDFRPAVEMYGGRFERIKDWEHFRRAFLNGVQSGGLHVLEMRTERASNVQMHRKLWRVVEQGM